MQAKREQLLTRVPPSLKEALIACARRNERSANAEAVVALRNHVAKESEQR
jgi:hypothetical protein